MIASICSNPKVLEVMRYINIFITIIRIVVPILLIFSLSFKLIKAVTSGNEDGLSKVKKNAPSNIIAAVVIFLIPSIVSLIVKVSFPNSDYKECLIIKSSDEINILYDNKMSEYVSIAAETLDINDYANALNYLKNIKDKNKRNGYQKKLDELKKQIDDKNKIQPIPIIDQTEIVQTAKQYIGKNVGTDCSGFVKHKVLKPLGYLQDEIATAAASCDGRSRGSNGMYRTYMQMGQIVWQRNMSAKNPTEAIANFPGDCVPGDVLFYSYGTNDCVKHVVIYAGFENGKHMIIDSNMYDYTVRYRAADAISWNAMALACARPKKVEG